MTGHQNTRINPTIQKLILLPSKSEQKTCNDFFGIGTLPKPMSRSQVKKRVLRLVEKLAIDSLFVTDSWPMASRDKAALARALKQHGLYVPSSDNNWTDQLENWALDNYIDLLLAFAGFPVEPVIVHTLVSHTMIDEPEELSDGGWNDRLETKMFSDGARSKLRMQAQIAYLRFYFVYPHSDYRCELLKRVMTDAYDRPWIDPKIKAPYTFRLTKNEQLIKQVANANRQ